MAKAIAFFLPQFHETPENNEWWGEGFTEWTNVKNAQAYFKDHNQPRRPFHDNYYNLLNKDTVIWQTKLLNDAGLEGLCYYHYWFKGRKILEKPAENLLEWKDVNQKFCFSWANESWVRTWSKVKGNDWNEIIDQKRHEKRSGSSVLLKQDYGIEADWVEHFEYLLPFFKDERYIKFDNKPIFLLYRASDIVCLEEMLACWQRLAKEAGLEGLYFVSTNESSEKYAEIDAEVLYEPGYTLVNDVPFRYKLVEYMSKICKAVNIPYLRKYNFDKFWEIILNRKLQGKKTFRGAFVGFDDTPRRGKNGAVFYNATPEKFETYYLELQKKCDAEDYIFITAWNEWAEGAYLEPDEKHGTKWLESIRKATEEK